MSLELDDMVQDRIEKLEERVNIIEVMSARVEERITSLADACDNLRRTVWYFMIIFGMLMLGIIGYGAIGDKGLHSVRENVIPIANNQNSN